MIQEGKLNAVMAQNVSYKMTNFDNFSSKRERKTQNALSNLKKYLFDTLNEFKSNQMHQE